MNGELATREAGEKANGSGRGLAHRPAPGAIGPAHSLDEVWYMAERVAESGLFGNCDTPQKAFTLMMICQSEGLHPIQALKRYHIIEGQPSKRSDAIQAEFQADGGKIEILRSDATEARALFSHPVHQPKPFEFAVTYKQFADTGMINGKYGVKNNWKNHPGDMLWARLVTKAIRKVHPGIVVGIYSSEEVEDLATIAAHAFAAPAPSLPAPAPAPGAGVVPVECAVIGHDGSGPDSRAYHQVATHAIEEYTRRMEERAGGEAALRVPLSVKALHGHLANRGIQLGYCEPPASTGSKDVLACLNGLYRTHRDFVRAEIMGFLDDGFDRQEAAIAEAREGREAEAAQAMAEAPAGREPGQDG